jgi:alpha-tubulin suppressor-like RCC1 family protein
VLNHVGYRSTTAARFGELCAGLAISMLVSVSVGCGNGPSEPDPFSHARSVTLWVYATGIEMGRNEIFRNGFTIRDNASSVLQLLTFPPGSAPWPQEYRFAWWSSNPVVADVDSQGLIRASSPGKVTIWVQVEGARDSSTIVVQPVSTSRPVVYQEVVPAGEHTCGLDAQGLAYCWGSDLDGALGLGAARAFTGVATPSPVAGGHVFLSAPQGFDHGCAVDVQGQAWCWGRDHLGQLGDGGAVDISADTGFKPQGSPVRVAGGISFAALAGGAQSACGLDRGGEAYCWGSNYMGQLGIGSFAPPPERDARSQPVKVVGDLRFTRLVAGTFHVCGLTQTGAAYCWGLNNRGQLGSDVAEQCAWTCGTRPESVQTDLRFAMLTAGGEHTCGLTTLGQLFCWGDNSRGQLGTPSVTSSFSPVRVDAGVPFSAVTAGAEYTCGLSSGGVAYCWGANEDGQLGNGTRGGLEANPAPGQVVGGLTFASVRAGLSHTCAVTSGGVAYCWGSLGSGRLGNGRVQRLGATVREVELQPVRVVEPASR